MFWINNISNNVKNFVIFSRSAFQNMSKLQRE